MAEFSSVTSRRRNLDGRSRIGEPGFFVIAVLSSSRLSGSQARCRKALEHDECSQICRFAYVFHCCLPDVLVWSVRLLNSEDTTHLDSGFLVGQLMAQHWSYRKAL